MPIHQQKPEMEPDPCPGDQSRGGSLESRSSSSRSRSFTLEDEGPQGLTHEEKDVLDVLQFFEETIDSLEAALEEQGVCDGGAPRHSPHPPEPEDVIDLVPPGPPVGEAGPRPGAAMPATGTLPARKEDAALPTSGGQGPPEVTPIDAPGPEAPPPASPIAAAPGRPRREPLPPSPPAEHPKLPRSVPTPLVIAQKISEQLAGDEALSPPSPWKEGRRTLPCPGEPPGGPRPRLHRFPSNISLTNSAGRDFSQTISRAAVSVQERKARVLANINGVALPAAGEPGQEAAGRQQSRGVQTDRPPAWANGFQSLHEALTSQPAPFVPTGKTVTFRPEPAASSRLARHQASRSVCEPRLPEPGQDEARPRSGSLPRAVGFRPQGVTVQFSGRGSSEEARREALRKLGLLKEHL
ncbi:proline and serine-rich protein 2 isoform X2 [Sorex araneus]|uniref:proline and serine-rich protein 2 isoform X2 n=1 Tax=Sorex araneus TaxID=42254 RepID=UPI0024340A9F|nr:proline and serine-rich protein 2 isoform X2 [Sorex araneus]